MYTVLEHMTFVVPDWETGNSASRLGTANIFYLTGTKTKIQLRTVIVLPVWEQLIFLSDWDKNKNTQLHTVIKLLHK